jgi:putative nucleotidyltransferase with HDIG domain
MKRNARRAKRNTSKEFCATTISKSAALELLRKYGLPEKRIKHSIGVAQFAFKLAKQIHAKHPELSVDPAKVRIAGLLHDIGRSQSGDHEINSVRILKQEGLADIAAIVMHGTVYETMRLRGRDDRSLLPHSLENKIVAYADARFRLSVVTLKKRMDEIKVRRANDIEKVKAVDMAMKRFYRLEKELLALIK